LTLSALLPAEHALRASYEGGDRFEASTSAPLTQVVNKAATALSLSSSANPAVWRQFVTFTASLSGRATGATAPGGTVTFKDGETVLGTATLNSAGRATFSTSQLASGSHTITAEYQGDANYQTSAAATFLQSVNKGLTSTTLTSSANPSSFAQAVTLTATVAGTGGTPAGSVEFYDGASLLGRAQLNGQTASLTTDALADGPHALTARYTGDEQFGESTSAVLTQTVSFICAFNISTASQSFDLAGGTGQVRVTSRNDCGWTAASNAPWITLLSGSSGTGDGVVSYTVAASPDGRSRTGTITVAGQTVTITQAKPVAVVSAASFTGEGVAAGAIVSLFGTDLAVATTTANSLPLPTEMSGTMVRVTDSQGVARLAPLFYVSPSQINYQVPEGTAIGSATVTVINGVPGANGAALAAASDGAEEVTGAGTIEIVAVAPALFTASADGRGVAAAVLFRLQGDGTQSYEPISHFDAAQNKTVPTPIDLGADTDEVFLVLFGTGVRNRTSLIGVTASVGGEEAEVVYAGGQGALTGLDQINLRLPRSLAGRGEVEVTLTVDGKVVNTVRIHVR
jgi:uncharacterized protein (TIGR03437 family)